MARVGRLAGAILAHTNSDFFLVGNTKRPCDWAAAGFASPGQLDPLATPYLSLTCTGALNVPGPWLELSVEGEQLASLLAARFVIARNGSVSDRLWRMVIRADPDGDDPPADTVIDARWLGEVPNHVWGIVRETVLKCL